MVSCAVQTCTKIRKNKMSFNRRHRSRRQVHLKILDCLKLRLGLDKPLKLQILASCLSILPKLPAKILNHPEGFGFPAAAVLMCSFDLNCVRDNTQHTRARLQCKKHLQVVFLEDSELQRQFARCKGAVVQAAWGSWKNECR